LYSEKNYIGDICRLKKL